MSEQSDHQAQLVRALKARAEAAETERDNLVVEGIRQKNRAIAAECKVARVEAEVRPGWHTNYGYRFDSPVEAYAAGRNDLMGRIRAVVGDEEATERIGDLLDEEGER